VTYYPQPPSNDPTGPIVDWPADIPPPKQRFGKGVIIGFMTAVLLAVIGIGGYFGITHYKKTRPFTMSGTLTVYSDIGLTGGANCRGTGGYSDIGPGAAVNVSDESGTLLAKGQLEIGSGESGWCSWPFRITDVPGGKKFYKVEVSHRGEVNFDANEARDGILLQLGDVPEGATNPPSRSAPPSSQPAAAPPPAPSPPKVTTLAPSGGYVYIVTKSGKTRCQITTTEVGCQAPFTHTPYVNGVQANGIRFTSDGSYQWVVGDLGDIPVVTLDYGTYRALTWTIDATYDGTTFTHGGSGHKLFVSIDRVTPS